MLYSDFVTALGALLQYPITSPASATPSSSIDFNNILPRIIESAEQRIYREMDFLATTTEDSTASLTNGSRRVILPTQIIILSSASFISPAATAPAAGTRNPLQIVSKDFIDATWPTEATTGTPQYIAQLSNTVCLLAPTPDAAYELECTGIFRPTPLSSTNTATYLTNVYPDLFLYAAMIFACGFQRDFGSQSDDPKMAMSWQMMYESAKPSTVEEEQRRKDAGTNWSTASQTPLSSPRP